MKNFFQWFFIHKKISGFILIVLILGGYYGYKQINAGKTVTKYVVSTAQKGTLTTSVSGSGQISVVNQVDVKSKASGDVLKVLVVDGQVVKNGRVLAYINASDAIKAVRDAQVNLDSTKLSLEKLKKPIDSLSLLQSQNSLDTAIQSKNTALSNLSKAYEDSFNSIANTFLNLPTIISDVNDSLYGTKIGESEKVVGSNVWNKDALSNTLVPDDVSKLSALKASAENDYLNARTKYDKNFSDYKLASRYSDRPTIETLLNETLETVKTIAQATKSESNLYDAWVDLRTNQKLPIFAQVTTFRTTLSSDTGLINNSLSNLLSVQNTIQSNKDTIINADRTIAEKTQSLADLKAGTDPLDLQSQELSVKQKQNTLLDAQQKLADYTIRAPFDGVVAKVSMKQGDPASNGTIAITLITQQRTAQISLNEVDAAKIKVGQKATLTFDAINDLSLTGEVAEIDTLGTISQGVVTYNVKIVFDTQDDRVKPGMSVSSAIITAIKQDVVVVSNSAIKSNNSGQYIEAPDETVAMENLNNNSGVDLVKPTIQKTVQTGLANDTQTEITNGLKEGDQIIVRTITVNSTPTTASQGQSLLPTGNRALGGSAGRATGGGFRGN